MIISRSDAAVEMSTHRALSGLTPGRPSRRPGISANWRRTSTIMAWAARPTDFMVSAANANVAMDPMKRPMTTSTLVRSITSVSPASLTAAVKDRNSASAVRAADPIAKPLATAAVVLPRASRPSVTSRTSAGRWAISAIPPALSEIGPYASTATTAPVVASMPMAARAAAYRPPLAAAPSAKARSPSQ